MGVERKIEKLQADYLEADRELRRLRREKYTGMVRVTMMVGKTLEVKKIDTKNLIV